MTNSWYRSSAEVLNDLVMPNSSAGESIILIANQDISVQFKRRLFEELTSSFMRFQQRSRFPLEIGVVRANLRQQTGALWCWAVECRLQYFFNSLPTFGIHQSGK